MKYIYMDNFRGFTDTVVPLQQVNILVGENSTGKTSFLALLERLSNPDFWFRQDFNSETYEFGGFSDIISTASRDKTEFRIGLCNTPSNGKELKKPDCVLMHFGERERIPFISRFAQATEDFVGTIVVRSRGLYYSLDKIENICGKRDDPYCLLRSVEAHARQLDSGLKKIPSKFIDRNVLATYSSVLYFLAKGKIEKEVEIHTLRIPVLTFAPFVSLAPIRTKPKPTYDAYTKSFNPAGEHTPYVLRKQLSSKSKATIFNSEMEKFGKESGLFKHIGIKKFGKTPSSPFEVTVTLEEQPLRIDTVGYGLSQALPIIVELIARAPKTWLSLQQPEIHLHPKAQAALGDLLFAVASNEKKVLFIETHSDHLIDRFRLNYRQKKGPQAQVLFFERVEGGNKVHILPFSETGEYPENQPSSFRAFFLEEQRKILGI